MDRKNMNKKAAYFQIPRKIFDANLSSGSKLVYAYLAKCADAFGKCWPSHKNIAACCSMSVTSVKGALEELKTEKWISSSHRYREKGGRSSNLYLIMKQDRQDAACIDSRIFSIETISSKAKLIYLYFSRCADEVLTCFPSHKTIAEKCNIAISTARKAIKELKDACMIQIETRTRENNGQTSNLYQLVSSFFAQNDSNKMEKNDLKGNKKETNRREIEKRIATKLSEPKWLEPEKIFGRFSDCIKSDSNRGHSNISEGGMLKYAYERTISKLRSQKRKKNYKLKRE